MFGFVLFYLVAFLISYRVYQRIAHPVVVFNFLWFVLLLISIYGNLDKTMGFYQPSSNTYLVFLIGGISFNVGALLFHFITGTKNKRQKEVVSFSSLSKERANLLTIAEMVLAVYYTFKSVAIARYLLSGQTYEVIRLLYFSEDMITSPLESAFIIFVSDPLLLLTEILFSINLFTHIFPKKLNYLMMFNLLLRTFISGGRTALFETGCLIIICAIYFGYLKNLRSKKTLGIIAAVYALVFLLVKVSSQRHGDEGGVMEIAYNNLVSYFIGSFAFFEDLLVSHDYLPQTYGMVTFGGISDIFIQIFRYLQLTDMPLTYISTGSILSEFRLIGDGVSYNAMPTMYYYFFTDFREFGYVLCPFVFGGISALIYNQMIRSRSELHFVYYMFIMVLIVESSFNWWLERIPFFLAVVFAYLLFRPSFNDKTHVCL